MVSRPSLPEPVMAGVQDQQSPENVEAQVFLAVKSSFMDLNVNEKEWLGLRERPDLEQDTS